MLEKVMKFHFKINTKEFKKLDLPINYDKASWRVKKQARDQYVKEQKGKCQYCGNSLDGDPIKEVKHSVINLSLFPKGFLNNPIHLHHSHGTGMTIGAIHARCNAYLWQYRGE